MRRIVFYLFLLLTAVAAHGQTLDDIFGGVLQAVGGADKIAAIQSLVVHGRQMWGGAQKRPMTISIKGAKVRYETDIQPQASGSSASTAHSAGVLCPGAARWNRSR